MKKQHIWGGKNIEAEYKNIEIKELSELRIHESTLSMNLSPETQVPQETIPSYAKAEMAY